MSKKLIINADDYGHTMGVTYGIIDAHRRGIVNSTTALSVSPYFFEAMELSRKFPDLQIGMHLTLTLKGAKPILGDKVPSLVDENGEFLRGDKLLNSIKLEEVELEWRAQFEKFLESGLKPTHIDSHHNVHGFTDGLLKIALNLAKEYGIPLRNYQNGANDALFNEMGVKTTTRCYQDFYAEGVTYDTIYEIFNNINASDEEYFEMNCHPGFLDNYLLKNSGYNDIRMTEIDILTSDDIKDALKESGIKIISFSDIV